MNRGFAIDAAATGKSCFLKLGQEFGEKIVSAKKTGRLGVRSVQEAENKEPNNANERRNPRSPRQFKSD
jgi:hypothetical protein